MRRVIAVLVFALAAASCGGNGEDVAGEETGEPSPASTNGDGESPADASTGEASEPEIALDIGYIAVSSAAPLHLAQEEGIFESHGLSVTLTQMEPPSIIPGVVGGDVDFGFLNAPAVLIARQNGLPVQAVAAVSTVGEDPADYFIQLMARGDSDIQEPQDLEGRTVAVAGLFQLPHLGLIAALQHHDVDPEAVEYREMPFPNMAQALADGDVDAVLAVEPFATLVQDAGGRVVLSASEGQPTNIAQSVVLASESYIADNTDVADRLVAAIDEAMTFAGSNTDRVREVIPTYTQIAPELAQRIRLGGFDPGFEQSGWEAWLPVLARAELVDEDTDVQEAYYVP